jgi:GT2 family glycosyltransferase
MNIHVIVVAYGLADDLLRLFERGNAPNIMWHLFLHSSIPAVVQACDQIVATYPNLYYYKYMVNRGLSCSWNDGLLAAYRDGADVALIANDDVDPEPDAIQIIAQTAIDNPGKFKVEGMMLDQRTNTLVPSQYGLTAINRIALAEIGYFDENIFPIYWEDIDYNRRAALAGLEMMTVESARMIHGGSKTSITIPGMVDYLSTMFNLNRDYYFRKWGGNAIGAELYQYPFNDSTISLRIPAERRHAPYLGYDRSDQAIVRM